MGAINEALFIANSDGLFENDIASVHEGSNTLRVNLKHTFARATQQEGERPSPRDMAWGLLY